MKNFHSLIFVLFLCFFGYSQEIPVLNVDNKPLGLSSLDIKVSVVGNIATTTYDMFFYNPTNMVLEGELLFPLGEGHNVSRFALDVNGKLREAVVVEKELGRIAFEAVVRRKVDPALLEKGTGNNYKARIYPIPASGYKRVVLAYEQELVFDNEAHYYNLPLSFKNKLDDFALEISVFDQKSKPVIEKGEISGLEFSNWEKNYTTKLAKKGYIPNKSLLIKIPLPLGEEKVITTTDYFYIYKTIDLQRRERTKPDIITIYWDASLSMKDKDIDKELNFLESYFVHIENVDVRFISFSDIKLVDKKFKIEECNWESLRNEIKQVIYDGGTSYEIFNETKDNADAVLLFSDGIASLSDFKLENKQTVFIVNSVVKSDHSALKYVAGKTNGAYINLKTKSIAKAMFDVKYEPFKFLGYKSTTKDIEVYPKSSVNVSHDFSVSGKNFTKGEKLILNFGYGNEITKQVRVVLNKEQTPNTNIRRIWAQKKLDDLEINAKANKTQISALGKEYSLVTDYTSLIVLDNIMDYIKYQITPPEELLEEYNRILAEGTNSRRDPRAMMESESSQIKEGIPISQKFDAVNNDELELEETIIEATEVEEEIIEIEEIEDIDTIDEAISIVPFSVIENTPIFPSCESNQSNLERKKCFSEKITHLIDHKFRTQLAIDLNLSPGIKRINARFVINSEGDIVNIEVRAPHRALGEEAIRVLKLLPKMTPGKQRGRPVDVMYVLPIIVNVEDRDTGRESVNTFAREESTFLKANVVSVPERRTTNTQRNNPREIKKTRYKKYSGDLTVKDRDVNTDYIVALRKAKNEEEAYQLYLKQREDYLKVPAYFIDVSNHFQYMYNTTIYSSRILSNIAETDFDNYELLKVYGYQLQVNNQNELALFLFKRILELRSEDSQSYRDVAIAYQNVGKYQEALDFFNKIVSGEIYKDSERRVFRGVKDITKNEIKRLIKESKESLDLSNIDKKLLKPVDFDIRVTTDWNHNDTDIDLHIIDPNLEECFYKHKKTTIGGKMSKDMTEGFGPEEFTLKNAIKGTYYIKIKYFEDNYQKVENPTFMKVTIFKNYGSKDASKETKLIRLTKQDSEEVIAKIVF